MLLVDVLELTVGRRRILSLKGHWIPMTIHRARLNGRAELLREWRHKTVSALRVDKEAYVQGIYEWTEHHLWSSDSHPADGNSHIAFLQAYPSVYCSSSVGWWALDRVQSEGPLGQ